MCGMSGNSRNGYGERGLVTCVGTLNLRVPQPGTGSLSPENVLERYQHVDRAAAAAVAEVHRTGTSTRKVQRTASRLVMDRLSKGQVGAICADLDPEVSGLTGGPLGDARMPYVRLDATCVKCRRDGRVASTASVTAIGCDERGRRRILGLRVADTESYEPWAGFLGRIRDCGVRGGCKCQVVFPW